MFSNLSPGPGQRLEGGPGRPSRGTPELEPRVRCLRGCFENLDSKRASRGTINALFHHYRLIRPLEGKRERGSQRIVLVRKINKIRQWNEDLDRGLMAPQPCSGCLGHPVFSLLEISFAALLAFLLGLSAAGLIHLPVPWPNFRRLRVRALSHAATNSPTLEA
ncbi:putative protein PRAC2 [Bubalus kerabau]|uniref:putative protein PRAC2 n=1 Tax=Bubalus carabanensis TaxID=3119969 RepID=UPI00244E9DF0|nr:putative protein PRAC2 [Bubalus carabanensis]